MTKQRDFKNSDLKTSRPAGPGRFFFAGKHLLDAKKMESVLGQMATQMAKTGDGEVALVGIRTRGVPLAHRLSILIEQKTKKKVDVGSLDITLYRDDLSRMAEHPVIKKTEINFPLDSKTVFLVDDVLHTGRTIRCALNALFDFGRPSAVKLAVLVDRGGREIPIQADVAGYAVNPRDGDEVKVLLSEIDGEDAVDLVKS